MFSKRNGIESSHSAPVCHLQSRLRLRFSHEHIRNPLNSYNKCGKQLTVKHMVLEYGSVVNISFVARLKTALLGSLFYFFKDVTPV